MTNWKRLNDLDKKDIKIFKKVLVQTYLAVLASLALAIFYTVVFEEISPIPFLALGFLLRPFVSTYISNFKQIANKIDNLK